MNGLKIFAGCLLAMVVFSRLASASTAIATLTTAYPFHLNGHLIATIGVTSWPIMVGDELQTTSGLAVLYFQDGSSVKLFPESRAMLRGSTGQPKLILMAGTLDYKLVIGSKLSISNLDMEKKHDKPVVASGTPIASLGAWPGTGRFGGT